MLSALWVIATAFSIVRGVSDDLHSWTLQKAVLERNRKVVDEVWLSTGCGFPAVEEHERRARRQSKIAKELRGWGILPGLQIQATIGHEEPYANGSKPLYRTWNGLTGSDGRQSWFLNCPRDERFHEYFRKIASVYASWQPSSVWIDDDLRLGPHGVIERGCYCDICLEAFSRQEGKSWDRENLVTAIKNDVVLEERWHRFSVQGLANLAALIVRTFHEYSPKTCFGLQYPWGDDVQVPILNAMSAACGRKVSIRPGYGEYSDRNPFGQIAKSYRIARQIKMLEDPSRFDQICPEIETAPRTFAMRTAQGLAYEALIHLAQGCNSLSWYIWCGQEENIDWREDTAWTDRVLFRALRENMQLYHEYEHINKESVACGFDVPDRSGRQTTAPDIPPFYSTSAIPYAPGGGKKIGMVLSEPLMQGCDADFIRQQLKGGVLVDRKTAMALSKQGLIPSRCVNIGCHEMPMGGRLAVFNSLDPYGANTATILRYGEWSDWVSRGSHPAVPLSPCLAATFPRIRLDGSFASLVVLNTRIDTQEPVTFRIRNFVGERAVWWPLWGRSTKLSVVREAKAGDVLITIPALDAWNAGFLAPAAVE